MVILGKYMFLLLADGGDSHSHNNNVLKYYFSLEMLDICKI